MTNKYDYPHANSHERLRQTAKYLIEQGAPPRNNGGSLSIDALNLLHERASNPESAGDALKLLHELQTYQVELDLLYEQLQVNDQEVSEELAYYRSLYEQAPAAYLVVTADGEIIEGNQAAGVFFGKPQQALAGLTLSQMLAPGQESAVRSLCSNIRERTPEADNLVNGSWELPDHRQLAISAKFSESSNSILLILTEANAF